MTHVHAASCARAGLRHLLLSCYATSSVLPSLVRVDCEAARQREIIGMARGVDGASAVKAARHSTSSWNGMYHMAIILERIPVLIREEEEWSRRFREFANKRNERVGLKVPSDVKAYFKLPENFENFGAERQRLEQIKKAPRWTEADEKNDTKSLNRRLEERLFFVARDISSYTSKGMGFPSLKWEFGSEVTGRALAEKALHEAKIKGSFETYPVGNAPAGHIEQQHERVFFFRTQFVAGSIDGVGASNDTDYAWLSLDELVKVTPPEWESTLYGMLK